MSEHVDHLARLIQQRMHAEHWSVRDVADRSGGMVGKSTVSNYVRGTGTMPPPMKVMQGLANGLEVPLRDVWNAVSRTLVGEADERDRLARFTHLTSDDVDELLELAKIRNDRRRRRSSG